MSEKLEQIAHDSDTTSQVINLTDTLNAAISRINEQQELIDWLTNQLNLAVGEHKELEARYEQHYGNRRPHHAANRRGGWGMKCWPWSHDWEKWQDGQIKFTYPLQEAGDPIQIKKPAQFRKCKRCGIGKRRLLG